MQLVNFLLFILGLFFLILGLLGTVISSQPAAQIQSGLIFIGSAIIVSGTLLNDTMNRKNK